MSHDSLPVIGDDTLEANLPQYARQKYRLAIRHHEQCHRIEPVTTLVEEYQRFLNSTMPKLDIVEREKILKAQNEVLFKKILEERKKRHEAQELARQSREEYIKLLEKRANIRK